MSGRTERALVAMIVGTFVVLGIIYSVVVPLFEASDELWHYPMVKYIADHRDLPVQDPANVGPWRQEGSQPPLYYALAAAATFWIDTSDMETVRHLNPHVDNGIVTPDGNINLVVHDPALEGRSMLRPSAAQGRPWRGTVLAVHLVRLLSVAMGAAAVYLTWLIVREVLPGQPILAVAAAAVHAFTPMVVFIAGAVNNDNLVIPLSSLALLMLLRMVNPKSQTPNPKPVRHYLLLGVVLGLAALTKTSSLALTVLTALVVVVRAVRRRSLRLRSGQALAEFITGGLATLLPLLLVAGWWYLRNLRLYGDPTGINVFIEILGQRDVPADLAQLWRERYSFAAGYWGNFGGLNVPMPGWAYGLLNALTIVAALGLVLLLLRQALRGQSGLAIAHWPLVICILWGLGVLIPWALWASTTWSSQGRLIFPAIPVWSLLLMLGLSGWLPRRWRGWIASAFALLLLGLSAVAPLAWIAPAYAPPQPLTDAQFAAIPHRLEGNGSTGPTADFGGVMRLLGYNLGAETVQPGEPVGVILYWEALAPADRDYTVFVHLLGEEDLLVAQRDTFPGLGRLSTARLESGFRWMDRYVVQAPATAYAPDVAQVEVGLYDAVTGTRLPVLGPGGETLGPPIDNVRFGRLEIQPRPGEYPNPISVNFGNRMALVGYALDRRAVRPGEVATLTLYWRGLRQMDTNYTISAQLVDFEQRKAAQQDGWPLEGAAPTAAWEPGQVIADVRALEVYPDAPPGVYDVRVAVYVLREGEIVHLPVIPQGGEMLSDHVALTRVRVNP